MQRQIKPAPPLEGKRLREVRKGQGYSLVDVEERSNLRFKSSVLGAYERGERRVNVPTLRALAQFYGLPAGYFIAESEDDDGVAVLVGAFVEALRSVSPGGLAALVAALTAHTDPFRELAA